jgi:hypothetical protein
MHDFFGQLVSELDKELAGTSLDTPGRQESFISDLFHLEHADSVSRPGKRDSCQSVRDPTLTLPIPVSDHPERLEQLIDRFVHPPIDSDTVKPTMRLLVLPRIFVIHLRRYHGTSVETPDKRSKKASEKRTKKASEKTDTPIDFPLRLTLDRTLLLGDFDRDVQYKLICWVVHTGDLERGHFWTHERWGSNWYECKDHVIKAHKKAPKARQTCKMAYLLVYERLDN